MATMNPHFEDRRHIPDRRAGVARMAESHADDGHVAARNRMTAADWLPMLLLAIGGINWGLVGLFEFDLVAFLFGEMSPISRIVYVVVGLCALYALYLSVRMSKTRR